MKLSEIDKNLEVPANLDEKDYEWFDVRKDPFEIYGLDNPRNADYPFHRMPFPVAKSVSPGVNDLNLHTAGGRIRFSTDSPVIAIAVETERPMSFMVHMTFLGSQGADLYENNAAGGSKYVGSFFVSETKLGQTEFSSMVKVNRQGVRSYTLNLPLYGTVKRLFIGLKTGSVLSKGLPYRNEKPFVFYGSSITQGGCATRPGRCYQAILSKHFNMNYTNLGFSGSAKGEQEIIDYMSKLEMCAFVCDYDHNAPTLEHLQKTLKNVYFGIRGKHSDIPFLFLSAPGTGLGIERRDYIESVYLDAVRAGDKNVFFIDGYTIYAGEDSDDCTVDGCHPTDFGFQRMADAISPFVKTVFGL